MALGGGTLRPALMRQQRHLPFVQQQPVGAEETAFGHGDRFGAAEVDRVQHGGAFRFDVRGWNDLMHEADALRLPRVEAFPGQGVAAGVPQADRVDHVGGNRRRRHAHAHLGDAEQRVRRRERHVDAANDADTAAETRAVHQRDGRLRKLIQQLHRPCRGQRGGEVLRRRIMRDLIQPADIGAGLEVLARAADDKAAHRRIGRPAGQVR